MTDILGQLSEPRLRQQAGIEKSQMASKRNILFQRVRKYSMIAAHILSFLLYLFDSFQSLVGKFHLTTPVPMVNG